MNPGVVKEGDVTDPRISISGVGVRFGLRFIGDVHSRRGLRTEAG